MSVPPYSDSLSLLLLLAKIKPKDFHDYWLWVSSVIVFLFQSNPKHKNQRRR